MITRSDFVLVQLVQCWRLYWQNTAGSRTKLDALGLIWKETKKKQIVRPIMKINFLINETY